jgi:hypothetical protein
MSVHDVMLRVTDGNDARQFGSGRAHMAMVTHRLAYFSSSEAVEAHKVCLFLLRNTAADPDTTAKKCRASATG